MERDNPVLLAIRERKGFAADLGGKLGITASAVWMWRKVPPKHAIRVAKIMKMPVRKVCPEIFPESKRPRKASGSARV